jgi:hypothetical protein
MPIDPALSSAIEQAVSENMQSPKLSKRIISWLQEMSEKELSAEENRLHLKNVKEAVVISTGPEL